MSKGLNHKEIIKKLNETLKEYQEQIDEIKLERFYRNKLEKKKLEYELEKKKKELENYHKELKPLELNEQNSLFLSQSYNNYSMYPEALDYRHISDLKKPDKLNIASNLDYYSDEENLEIGKYNSDFLGVVNQLCQKYSKINL